MPHPAARIYRDFPFPDMWSAKSSSKSAPACLRCVSQCGTCLTHLLRRRSAFRTGGSCLERRLRETGSYFPPIFPLGNCADKARKNWRPLFSAPFLKAFMLAFQRDLRRNASLSLRPMAELYLWMLCSHKSIKNWSHAPRGMEKNPCIPLKSFPGCLWHCKICVLGRRFNWLLLSLDTNASRPRGKRANAYFTRQVALWESRRIWEYNLTYVGVSRTTCSTFATKRHRRVCARGRLWGLTRGFKVEVGLCCWKVPIKIEIKGRLCVCLRFDLIDRPQVKFYSVLFI